MKTLLKYLIILLTPCFLSSQSERPTEGIKGTYYLLEAERGISNKPTKIKLLQYNLLGKSKVLTIAACNEMYTINI